MDEEQPLCAEDTLSGAAAQLGAGDSMHCADTCVAAPVAKAAAPAPASMRTRIG